MKQFLPHRAVVAGLVMLALGGCEKLAPGPDHPAAAPSASHSQGVNPFSVNNMRQAYDNVVSGHLTASSTATHTTAVARPLPDDCFECPTPNPTPTPNPPPPNPGPNPVQPTHWYLRFKPANNNQLADLGDLGFELSWEPMDESVAYYTTVDYQASDIPWIYTVVPVGTALPGAIAYEKIEDLYLFSDEDGDSRDPWMPAPNPGPDPCGPQWDPSCQCYVQCATSPPTPTRPQPSNQALATARLKQLGVSPQALYAEAMRLSQHEDELAPSSETGGKADAGSVARPNARYHPSGQLLVQDTEIGNVPLRGVEVKSRRWFQFGSAFTDNQGNFYINTSYRSLAKLSVQFKNDLATTRGVVYGVRVWDYVLPITAGIGDYEDGDMQGLSYCFTFQGGLDKQGSKGASSWAAASLFNALADVRAFAASRGIPPPPQGINVWLFPEFPSNGLGAAPMLRKIASTSAVSQIIDYLLASSSMPYLALVKQLLQRQLPDISIRYGTDQGAMASHVLNPLLYHELGHTQHYTQAGNNFWTVYIAYIVAHGGYGGKTDSGASRIALSEGWGNYTERSYTSSKYQGTAANFRASNALTQLEGQIPSANISGDYGWLVYGMYHDMIDGATEPAYTGVVDNVTAYSTATVFRGLQSDVVSVREYQNRVNTQNNNLQAPALEQLVTSYQW